MRLRNGEHGYGAVTKLLHWLTVALLAAQFTVGYTMETDTDVPDVACDPAGEDRSGGDTSDAEDEQLDLLEDRCEAAQDRREDEADDAVGTAWSDLWSGDALGDGLTLPEWHVLLGLSIIAVGATRIVWRRTTPLPPWDPRLTDADRRVLHVVEPVLLGLLIVVPATGIALVVGTDDLVPLHVAAHLCFFAALAVHVFVVVRRHVVGRMLPL
ncbi:cytochrome b [Antribacter gilvus]|uniref:cytochrome b n=1 Tax=Antribacter gilvus TaxID=2304675 RepID=UPI000F774FEB|nr:cytochrome b/b6 domain-containing protein [Antribacter gilvus]